VNQFVREQSAEEALCKKPIRRMSKKKSFFFRAEDDRVAQTPGTPLALATKVYMVGGTFVSSFSNLFMSPVA
jgi:hypothetical protein